MREQTLLPYLFKWIGKHKLVYFVNPEGLDWSQGFFKLALPSKDHADHIMPFDDWLAGEPQQPRDFNDVSAIFHVSRCGSTLLSQNLKATGEAFVLSEPPFFRILRHRFANTIDYATALQASLAMLHAWKRWAMNRSPKLVIKFNSQLHWYRKSLFSQMSGARFLFLYREPIAVLESLQRKPPAYLGLKRAQARIPLINDLANVACDPVVLDGANRYCTALDAFARTVPDECLFVGYPELEQRYGEVLSHLGFDPSSVPDWSAVHNAKSDQSKGPQTYRPVMQERLDKFAQENAELLSVTQRYYDSFSVRQSRKSLVV